VRVRVALNDEAKKREGEKERGRREGTRENKG